MRQPRYLPMVRWYSPRELGKTLIGMISARLITRVIDPRTLGQNQDEVQANEIRQYGSEMWFDFVADLGDGWNSTHSVARVVAAAQLRLHDPAGALRDTRRADLLVLGGDLVYPSPDDRNFAARLLDPYKEALPASADRPEVLAIPGDHDWFDGLATFRRHFCHPGESFAAWRTIQRQSYFAASLPGNWWLLGVDGEPGLPIDVRQRRLFERVASRMNEDSRVIAVFPRPDWLYSAKTDGDASDATASEQLEAILRRPIDVCIAGDSHHYRRHETLGAPDARRLQRITCGGGGAFMAPTHDPLPQRLRGEFSVKGTFPPPSESLAYRGRLLAFPITNPSFGILPASLYALLAFFAYQGPPGAAAFASPTELLSQVYNGGWSMIALLILFFAPLAFYEHGKSRSFGLAAAHATLQAIAALSSVVWAWSISGTLPTVAWGPAMSAEFVRLLFFLGVTFALGWLVGSALFGIYLWLSVCAGCLLSRGYAALRIEDWKSFLRVQVRPNGRVTIYPIGLRRVARNWRRISGDAGASTLQPEDVATPPELIEMPIELGRR